MSLIVTNVVCTAALVGLVWTAQLVHYPLMRFVGPATFGVYHADHVRRMTWVAAPLMAAEAIAAAALAAHPWPMGAGWAWMSAVLTLICWLSTMMLQVPLHRELALGGLDETLIERLVRTNWIRTGAWTARLAILIAAGSSGL